jgi:hypothetical protein
MSLLKYVLLDPFQNMLPDSRNESILNVLGKHKLTLVSLNGKLRFTLPL